MSVTKEKLTLERDYLVGELKTLDKAMKDLKIKFDDQQRHLLSVCSHKKNPAAGMSFNNEITVDGMSISKEEKAREES